MWGCPEFISTRNCQGNSLTGSERRPSCSCKQLEWSLCFLLLQMFPWATLQPPLRVTQWWQRHLTTRSPPNLLCPVSEIENVPLGGSEVGVCSFLSSGQAAAGSSPPESQINPRGEQLMSQDLEVITFSITSGGTRGVCSLPQPGTVGWTEPLQFPNHQFWCFSLHKHAPKMSSEQQVFPLATVWVPCWL